MNMKKIVAISINLGLAFAPSASLYSASPQNEVIEMAKPLVLSALPDKPSDIEKEQPELSPLEKRKARKKKQATLETNKLEETSEKPPEETVDQAVERILEKAETEDRANIEFNFENADLRNLVDYIGELFGFTFLIDEAIEPVSQTGKAVTGNKISFRTERIMNKKEAWSLFTTLLDIAGLSIAKTPKDTVFRISSSPAVNKMPLTVFIGTNPEDLPDNDTKIRYIYFLKNATVETIKPIVDQLRSATSLFSAFMPLRAIILTDKAYNIKSLMSIVMELDKNTTPEMLSVLKLKNSNAEEVKKLFDELTKGDDPRGTVARIFGARKQTDSFVFPDGTRVVAEPRTNSLIIFGTQDTIKKIETFIKQIDAEFTDIESPLYIYELQYTDATSMAEILNKVTQFGIGTVAGQTGSVREGQKYFKGITFTPEKSGNRLIIKADYEDYLKAKEIIDRLDVMQPQVAIEVLIINVSDDTTKTFGSQMRNKNPDTIAPNVDFQNSGLFRGNAQSSPVIDPTSGSIMANLISLASGNEVGSTLLTLGANVNIWAIFKALNHHTNATVVSNPFLTTSNKYKAAVVLGETRRIQDSEGSTGGSTLKGLTNKDANLEVTITPQINTEGVILMDIFIKIDEFTSAIVTDGAKLERKIETKAAVANNEVFALGGLIRNRVFETKSKVPILGDIPVFGWLFKNQQRVVQKQNLLIFIAPHIVQPTIDGVHPYTQNKANYSRTTLKAFDTDSNYRDPINRWFFKGKESATQQLDDFMNKDFDREGKKLAQKKLPPKDLPPKKPSLVSYVAQDKEVSL